MDNIYSVSQVSSYIKNMFASDYALNSIYIKGEVSNCKYHSSGHIYFTLKDTIGQMTCVMFAGQRSGLSFRLSEGQSVIALGSVSVYERDGKYQLYAKEIILDGTGRLFEKFEQLKKQLETEGLFDPIHKKKIPYYSHKIGIVTAKTGAAIQDIIHIANRRNPYAQLILLPAQVQGEGAAKTIVRGIQALDQMHLDVIIIGRGGGSIEDLWAFNEEVVARAIYECKTPIISAVGHETDTTISDFVSDLRAPTPSAAAELAVADIEDICNQIKSINGTLNQVMYQKLAYNKNLLDKYKMQLEYASPIFQLRQKRQRLMEFDEKLHLLLSLKIKDMRHDLAIYIEKMNGLSPLSNLNKGYSYVTDTNNRALLSTLQVKPNEKVQIMVKDGDIIANVETIVARRRE